MKKVQGHDFNLGNPTAHLLPAIISALNIMLCIFHNNFSVNLNTKSVQ